VWTALHRYLTVTQTLATGILRSKTNSLSSASTATGSNEVFSGDQPWKLQCTVSETVSASIIRVLIQCDRSVSHAYKTDQYL
jgi:hypothetical protein